MAKKTFEWLFYLLENLLTPLNTKDFTARVQAKRLRTISDIADHIVGQRTEYRKETIVNILTMAADAELHFLSQGDRVNTGTVILEPGITGTFDGTTNFDSKTHRCVVNSHVTNAVNKMLEEVTGSYMGLTVENGGAAIEKVTDSLTGNSDGTVTPGKVITIAGKKIKVVPEEGETTESCITYTNIDSGQIIEQADALVVNDPTKLILQLPVLPQGSYTLAIKTLFSTSAQNLVAPRIITFKTNLVVQ